jgi:hypothetical protein
MPQRNVATNFTFEQQRLEINLLAQDFWTQKGTVDTAASTYLKHDGTNAFTGQTLAVPNAFTINSNSGNGTVTISGNLDVTGTTTTVSSANLEVTDKNILISKGSTTDAQADGAGITIDSDTDITWNFVDAKDAWVSSIGVESTTFLKATTFLEAARGQFTGSTSPSAGSGVEVNAPDANTGQIIAYNRGTSAYNELRLRASSVPIYTGTTNALAGTFNSTGLTMESGKTLGVGVAPKSGEGTELAVKGSDGATNIALIPAADTEFSQIAFYNAAYDSQQGYIKYDNNDNSLQFRVNLQERLRIDSNGDLNLGNNPTNQYGYKLNIQDDAILYAQTASSNGTELKLYLDHSNTIANFGTVSTSHLAFVTANEERLRIHESNGSILVNNGNAENNAILVLSKADAGYAKLEFDVGTSQKAYVELDASEDLVHYGAANVGQTFYAGGSTALTIDSSQNAIFNGSVAIPARRNSGGTLETGASSNWFKIGTISTLGGGNRVQITILGTNGYGQDDKTVGHTIINITRDNGSTPGVRGHFYSVGTTDSYAGVTDVATKPTGTSNQFDVYVKPSGHYSNLGSFVDISTGAAKWAGSTTDTGSATAPTSSTPLQKDWGILLGGSHKLGMSSDGKLLLGTQRTFGAQAYYDDITINNSNESSGSAGSTGINLISGNNTWGAILFGDSDDDDVGSIKYSHIGNYLRFTTDGATRMELNSNGDMIPEVDNTQDIGSASKRWANVYTGDMHLNNMNSGGNDVDGSEGHWTMQEGANDLFLINRNTGKKYKFNLTEVS